MLVEQGDIFWIDLGELAGAEPGSGPPHDVVQNSLFNQSRINTAVVCVVTSKLRLAAAPGNARMGLGGAVLSRETVVNESQLYTVDNEHWWSGLE
jgi:mRNA interferase MazF